MAPWRAVGLQLCEGVDRNFDLLEQWLAHIVQRPAERTNISFGLVGARQGVYKNAFFDPVRTILGKHNCIDDQDIHKFIESSHQRTQLAGKLLCVMDEAKNRETKLFQANIKVSVTGAEAWLSGPHSWSFLAWTVKVYAVPFVSPVTVHVSALTTHDL